MNPVMYILSDPSLEMSAGKLAAQVGHASVEAYRLSCKHAPDLSVPSGASNELVNALFAGHSPGSAGPNYAMFEETRIANRWRRGGHYTKIILQCDDLPTASTYIEDRGFKTSLIIDEGRTEIAPLTATALGVEIVDKDSGHVQDTFSAFKLYQQPSTPVIIECAGQMDPTTLDAVRGLVWAGRIDEARQVARDWTKPRRPKRQTWRKFL